MSNEHRLIIRSPPFDLSSDQWEPVAPSSLSTGSNPTLNPLSLSPPITVCLKSGPRVLQSLFLNHGEERRNMRVMGSAWIAVRGESVFSIK